MKAVIQRVSQAKVTVTHTNKTREITGRIDRGFVVLLGVADGDTEQEALALANKIVGLRVFEDEAGKMNLPMADIHGEMLVASQFTLLGDCRKGRRPSFTDAAPPELAEQLYEQFVTIVAEQGIPVCTGRFQRHMDIQLTNDGPVTLLLDTRDWQR